MVISPFDRLCMWLARSIGTSAMFMLTCAATLGAVGAALTPAWRESVNTWGGALTGYLSLLLLIILQNGQNREGAAIHAKLDEMIRVTERARDELIGSEALPAEQIAELRSAVAKEGS